MKKFTLIVFSLCILLTTLQSQNIELTFTAIDNIDYTQLDSIRVMNRTRGGDTVLYYPDTVLSLLVTGINESISNEIGFNLFQNYPNPVLDQTTIKLQIPLSGMVNITITDIQGRIIVYSEQEFEMGGHSFSFTPGGADLYFLTAKYKYESKSIKILTLQNGSGNKASLSYIDSTNETTELKTTWANQSFFFNYGDELLYIGYYDTLQSGMLDSPDESDSYIFQFAYDIPCPGTPTIQYEDQVYNTVQIMSQCWLKENLNIGTMIQSIEEMIDNDTIEKYCYNNEPDSCTKYGGLYQWWEIMQYTSQQGVQGICPPGWHLPTDEEWKILEGGVDSQYGIGDPEWDTVSDRGYNAGTNLKTTSGWNSNNNGSDLFGFSALPGGFFGSGFATVGILGFWWTSTEQINDNAWIRRIAGPSQEVQKGYAGKELMSFSVRCIRDE